MSLVEKHAGDPEARELIVAADDELIHWSFLRYSGPQVFGTLEEAFSGVLGRFFFPPAYVWLNGRFIDMSKVPTVRVGGTVAYSAVPSSDRETVRADASPARGNP